MIPFILKRLAAALPLLVGVTILVFLMTKLVPGDPVTLMLGQDSMASAEDRERLREELGFNRPLHMQYWVYFGGLIQGDLGDSLRARRPVLRIIQERILSTLQLATAGVLIAITLGVGLGLLAAMNHHTWIDNAAVALALIGVSVPSFWLGLLLMALFSIHLQWLPVLGHGDLRALILPSVTLGIWAAGDIARLTRSSVLEVKSLDYVRTARSKGIPSSRIAVHHILRTALILVTTVVGIRFGSVLAGTVIIESVFSRPGLGLTLLNAIIAKDFPLIQGVVLFVAVTYILMNLLVEVAYTRLDPRIEYA